MITDNIQVLHYIFIPDWSYVGNAGGIDALRNQLRSIHAMVGDVEATLYALEHNRPLPQPIVPEAAAATGPPPLPFADSAAIREYLSNPRNVAILASYIMEEITAYSAATFPRELASLILSPNYKTSVYWTPVAQK